jgi:hypothetical protein
MPSGAQTRARPRDRRISIVGATSIPCDGTARRYHLRVCRLCDVHALFAFSRIGKTNEHPYHSPRLLPEANTALTNSTTWSLIHEADGHLGGWVEDQ